MLRAYDWKFLNLIKNFSDAESEEKMNFVKQAFFSCITIWYSHPSEKEIIYTLAHPPSHNIFMLTAIDFCLFKYTQLMK